MRPLLIVLSAIAILAAVFLGGCAVLGVVQVFLPPRPAFTYAVRGDGVVAFFSLIGGFVAIGLLVTNVALFRSVRGGLPLGREAAVRFVAGLDLVVAVVSLLLAAVSWPFAVVFATFAAKGFFTLRWAAASRVHADSSGLQPRPRTGATQSPGDP
jgi:hypothetical protein